MADKECTECGAGIETMTDRYVIMAIGPADDVTEVYACGAECARSALEGKP